MHRSAGSMALSSVYRAMMGALGVVGAVSITFSPLAAQRPDGSSRRAPAAVEAPDTTPVGEADSGEGRPFRGRLGGKASRVAPRASSWRGESARSSSRWCDGAWV